MTRSLRMASAALVAVLLILSVAATPVVATSSASSWPQHLTAAEGLNVAAHIVSGETLYQLVSKTLSPIRGPYVLERRDLRTEARSTGPQFPVGNITLASGYLWVNGASASRPQLYEVDPKSLRIIRSIKFPKGPTPYPFLAVTAGPERSLWVGTSNMLHRIDVASGRVLTSMPAPAGLAVGYLDIDPVGRHLYASMAHVDAKGGLSGGAVFEYDARSGRKLAEADSGLITYSVAGAGLTAVPGGVWASFRTGMLGLTIHLRQRDLAEMAPPGKKVALSPANTLFHWPMSASTFYAGGALWVANESGIIACLDPQTAKVRASERIPPDEAPAFVGVDLGSRTLFIVGATGRGVMTIRPPQRCWR